MEGEDSRSSEERGDGGALRLALFLSGLSGGGAQRRVLALAHGFAARGHRVELVVVRAAGPFAAQIPSGVRLVALEPAMSRLPVLRRYKSLWVIAAAPELARYLRGARPDVLLSTSNPANLAALWARRLAAVDVPIVVTVNVHLSEATGARQPFWGRWLRALARRFYPRADAIIAISRGVAADLEWSIPAAANRITTVYNPVDLADIERLGRERVEHPWFAGGGAPVILAVGKLKRQKDFPTLLRALRIVRATRPARLVILGEGEERRRLQKLALSLGIADDVALPGFIDNPFPWMTGASVFVLSSAWEGFSNVLLEALACGCPVVSTDCPSGPAEILAGGLYGPLVPVGDADALAAAIVALLEQPPDRERLRRRARDFSLDAAVNGYLKVLLAMGRTGAAPRRRGASTATTAEGTACRDVASSRSSFVP
jgi:glycosyltransferase involved in cell wall biosynthesis